MEAVFANHRCAIVAHTPGVVLVVRMAEPRTHDNAVTVVCTARDGIAILGDGAPGRDGCVAGMKRTLGWFSRRLSAGDVCDAFLEKTWQPARAFRHVARVICEQRRWGAIGRFDARDAYGMLHCHDVDRFTPDEARAVLAGVADDDSLAGGFDFDPNTAARLCAIQRAFARGMARVASDALAKITAEHGPPAQAGMEPTPTGAL
jgi:hypothetical protein